MNMLKAFTRILGRGTTMHTNIGYDDRIHVDIMDLKTMMSCDTELLTAISMLNQRSSNLYYPAD